MSAIGKMFIKYCKYKGDLKVISLVRRKEYFPLLEKEGSEYHLDMTDSDFEEKLTKLAAELEATACIDSIGGDLSSKLFKAMPRNSTLYTFGYLSSPIMNGLDMRELIS